MSAHGDVLIIVMVIDNNDVYAGNQSRVNCSVTMTEKRHSDGSWYYITISMC